MNKIFVWITALSLPSNLFSLRLLKNCTSRFPRISIKFTDLRKHPFTISVLLLTVVWVQVECFFFFHFRHRYNGKGLFCGSYASHSFLFHLALRYVIHETKLVLENSAKVAVISLPSAQVQMTLHGAVESYFSSYLKPWHIFLCSV